MTIESLAVRDCGTLDTSVDSGGCLSLQDSAELFMADVTLDNCFAKKCAVTVVVVVVVVLDWWPTALTVLVVCYTTGAARQSWVAQRTSSAMRACFPTTRCLRAVAGCGLLKAALWCSQTPSLSTMSPQPAPQDSKNTALCISRCSPRALVWLNSPFCLLFSLLCLLLRGGALLLGGSAWFRCWTCTFFKNEAAASGGMAHFEEGASGGVVGAPVRFAVYDSSFVNSMVSR